MRLFALSGTHHAGKTTTLKDVATALDAVGLRIGTMTDVARGCPHPLGLKSNYSAQKWILDAQIQGELKLITELERGNIDVGLTDRTLFDHAVYISHLHDINNITYQEYCGLMENYNKYLDNIKPYKHIFYLDPLPIRRKDDPIPGRSNEKYQKYIAKQLFAIITLQQHFTHITDKDRLTRQRQIARKILAIKS